MKGTVVPRPAKYVMRRGTLVAAPLRPYEEWTNPNTGKTIRAGAGGSTWTWRISTGSRVAGNRRYYAKGGYATKKLCEDALARAMADLGKGDMRPLAKPETVLTGDYLHRWLNARDNLKPSTRAGYHDAIRCWIAPRQPDSKYRPTPYLGAILLADIGPDQLETLFRALRAHGGRITKAEREAAEAEGRDPVGRPLGSRSVKLAYTVLNMALADAAESGKTPSNPVARIPRRLRPSHKATKQAEQYWEPGEARAFLIAQQTERLAPLWSFALDTGGRRSEIAGLSWPSLDLETGKAKIRTGRVVVGREVIEGGPKSSRPRTVDLGPRTVIVLKAWKKIQENERELAGDDWCGNIPGISGYVFTNEIGEPLRPDWLADEFERCQRGLGLPPISIHGLRHTSATIALAKKVPVHVVSERLGHATVSITLDIYAHVIPSQGSDAARIIGSEIYGRAEDDTDDPEGGDPR
jgi:integrase